MFSLTFSNGFKVLIDIIRQTIVFINGMFLDARRIKFMSLTKTTFKLINYTLLVNYCSFFSVILSSSSNFLLSRVHSSVKNCQEDDSR